MKKNCLLFMFLTVCISAFAKSYNLSATINGAQQVPSNTVTATGSMTGTYDDVTNVLSYTITYSGLSSSLTAMHFHGNAAAGINTGVKANIGALASPVTSTVTVDEADEAAMLGGMWYINLHTTNFGGGEIRGQVAATAAKIYNLSATINGAQQVPSNSATATGSMTGTYNDATNVLSYTITYTGLSSSLTAMHFHGNAAAGVNTGVKANIGALASPVTSTVTVDEADETAMLSGMWYINLHTTNFGGGEIRGQVAATLGKMYNLSATINGAQQVPSNSATATGSMTGTYDDVTNVLSYTITYSGLSSALTAMHFHGNAAAGVNTGVKANIGALASPVTSTVTVDEADEAAMLAGMWYINLHTTNFGGGEIRGQVGAAAVVLSVDLLKFTAVSIGEGVRLDWQTANEINNKGFKISHSDNVKDWETLDFVPSKSVKSAYSFIHKNPIGDIHYYRLIQTDFNDKTTVSKTLSVRINEKKMLVAFPTKVESSLTIMGHEASEYSIVDLTGRQILSGYLIDNQTVVNVSTLVSGIYFVVTKEGSAKFSKL